MKHLIPWGEATICTLKEKKKKIKGSQVRICCVSKSLERKRKRGGGVRESHRRD